MYIVLKFTGRYRFLGGFFYAKSCMDGIEYPTIEHAFKAAKTLDTEERKHIASLPSPLKAKHYWVKELREDWHKEKLNIREELERDKYRMHDNLRQLLIDTNDDKLVYGNYHCDNYWGDCYCESCKFGPGRNHLGRILMKIRKEVGGE